MNGDLSLSQALGGLRIANPDDSADDPDSPLSPNRLQSSSVPFAADSNLAAPAPGAHAAGPALTQGRPAGLGHADSYRGRAGGGEPASALLRSAQSNSSFRAGPAPPLLTQPDLPSPLHQPPAQHQQYPPDRVAHPGRGPRPGSGMYGNPATATGQGHSSAYGALRGDPARASVYGASGASYGGPAPSREPSRRERAYDASRQMSLPPGGGPLPPPRSSRGMAGGYATLADVPMVPHTAGYPLDIVPGAATSDEWAERGAAVGSRRETDAGGRTIVRSTKKGVRDFSFGRTLGEGSYSTVYLATDRQTLREYAIKVLEKRHIIKERKIKYVNIEKNTLNRLEHPGIVRLYFTFQDETSLYYVLDLCSNGELLGSLKRTGTFDVECTRFYGAQILSAIEYMHSRGVIHRDLKPENVLLDEHMHIKITDFGTAKMQRDPREQSPGRPDGAAVQDDTDEDERARSFVGTAEYVSPELLSSRAAYKASDLWAFGCIVYQLLAGRPPFKAATEFFTFQKIVNLEYDFPPGFPPAARDLIERLLVIDPARRLTIEHIKNHEFFDGQPFGRGLWQSKAPRLRPHQTQAPERINLNGTSRQPPPSAGGGGPSQGQPQTGSSTNLPGSPAAGNVSGAAGSSALNDGAAGHTSRTTRIITELPPPTQLDIEWSPVLTRDNERILRLSDQMVISSPLPNSPHGKGEGESNGHKKLARFFGGSTTKKRQRLVMVTSSGRIVLAPAGGEEKKAKQEIPLTRSDCVWWSQRDAKGQVVWCVDTGGSHYQFEETKASSAATGDAGKASADDWLDAVERARDLAQAQSASQTSQPAMSSTGGPSDMSSPASTMGASSGLLGSGTSNTYAVTTDGGSGFGVSDRSGRNHITKSQEDVGVVRRNRFSKRQSKSGLGVGQTDF